jgi:hypothetical protein
MSASSDMSLTDWTMPNGWRPDGLRVIWEFAYVAPNSEKRLELLANGQVRFENGDAHGRWDMEDFHDPYITFHYLADTSKMNKHHFRRISRTDDFVLHAQDADWFRVLCRRHPPVQAAD